MGATKLGVLFALAITVTACGNTSNMESQPQERFSSDRQPDELAACISKGWLRHQNRVAAVQPRENGGFVVILPHFEGVDDAVATIARAASGTSIGYAERMPGLSPAWFKNEVVQCL